MHDHSTIDQNGQALFGENTTAGDFRQIFGRIASRIGNTKLQLKASRESASPSAELQLAATQEALARAHVSLVQLGLELDSERRSRQSAESDARDERRACEEAMHLLRESVQPLRDLQAAAVEHRAQSRQQAQAYSALESQCESQELRLKESESALTRALEAAVQMRAQADSERLAYAGLESRLAAEQLSRADAHAQTHAERLARLDTDAKFQSEQLARAECEAQLHAERLARQHAQDDAQSARDEHRVAEQSLTALQQESAAHRELAEKHALEKAELEVQRDALETLLKENEAILARAKYAAYRHAQRHAQMTVDLEKERRARARAEAVTLAERSARGEL